MIVIQPNNRQPSLTADQFLGLAMFAHAKHDDQSAH